MNWLKENWFKLVLTLCLLVITLCVMSYITVYIPQRDQADRANNETIKNMESNKEVEKPTTTTIKPMIPVRTKPAVDPQVKIESCKAQAKLSADSIARSEYLRASEAYAKEGMTEEAAFMLEASFGPKHPASYDGNYQKAYIKCLNS
jgi:uncharacterized protein YxeA